MTLTPASARSVKGEKTRSLILEKAIELFRQRGYDETTMRMIAEHAGVALGNAYYYFASKEHLVQGLYEQLEAEQLDASTAVLAREKSFKNRLAGAILAELTVLEPY